MCRVLLGRGSFAPTPLPPFEPHPAAVLAGFDSCLHLLLSRRDLRRRFALAVEEAAERGDVGIAEQVDDREVAARGVEALGELGVGAHQRQRIAAESENLSLRPTRATRSGPRTSRQTSAIVRSVSVRGGT